MRKHWVIESTEDIILGLYAQIPVASTDLTGAVQLPNRGTRGPNLDRLSLGDGGY